MSASAQVVVCFELVAEIAERLGVSGIDQMPGLWQHKIDDRWTVKVNGHGHEIGSVPPYHMLVEFNGWTAGLVHPLRGGIIGAGALANEDTFIEALQKRLRELPQAAVGA